MDDTQCRTTIESIVASIEKTGMDPYAQLYGYLTTGNLQCITRTGNARTLIRTLKWQQVWDYVQRMERQHDGKKIHQGK